MLRYIPVIGFLARCIEEERTTDLYILIANLLMATTLAVIVFGYPAVILIALVFTLLIGAAVLMSTRG